MNFEETLDYLYDQLPMFQRVGKSAFKKNLDNTIALCEHLGHPQNKFKSVHIAGTNGKGSSAHMIASVLQEAGYKTGLYTSPHLYRFTERIRINGVEAEPAFIVTFVEKHKSVIEKIRPSFFELTVAMTFEYFAVKDVEIAIIETGLGGRLDSTNVIMPAVSLITNISLDHTDMLGETIAKIASEKAGIIKKGVPVVIGEYQEETGEIFLNKALRENAPVYFASQLVIVNKAEESVSGNLAVDIRSKTWGALQAVRLDNTGNYQIKNLPGVIRILEILNDKGWSIQKNDLKAGLAKVKENTRFWGRWEVLSRQPLVICDTAHNAAGVKAIVEQLETLEYDRLHIVWGMVADKNVEEILMLLPEEAKYYFCNAHVPRALEAIVLTEKAQGTGRRGMTCPDVNEAIDMAFKHADDRDIIFIGGSNFVIAEINRNVYEKKTAKI